MHTENKPSLRLARFEMSVLVSNLLRTSMHESRRHAQEARALLLTQDARALAYCAPERLRFLLGRGMALEDQFSDVYSLGMLVSEWFVGPLPEELLAAAEDALLAAAGGATEGVIEAGRRINEHVHQALASCPRLIGELLRRMISLHAPSRPTAGTVVDELGGHYESLVSGSTPEEPYLLLFMPTECRETLLPWGVVANDPASPAGRRRSRNCSRRICEGLGSSTPRRGHPLHAQGRR